MRHSLLKRCCEVFRLEPSPLVLRHIVCAFLQAHDECFSEDMWGNTGLLRTVCQNAGCEQVIQMLVRRQLVYRGGGPGHVESVLLLYNR